MKKLLDEMIDEASELEPIFDAADEIRRLEDEIAEETKAKSYNIVRRLIGRQRELQHRLAVDFGERRGWRLADKPFGIDALIRGKVSGRNSPWVKAMVRACTLAGSGGMRDLRVLSRNSPVTPDRMNRSCQRHTVTLLVPACRIISLVPIPSAVSSTIRARHTCFCPAIAVRNDRFQARPISSIHLDRDPLAHAPLPKSRGPAYISPELLC